MSDPRGKDEHYRYRAYLVCQQRGHSPANLVLTSNPPQNVCEFCGTHYRFTEPQLVETGNVPERPADFESPEGVEEANET